MGGDTGREIEKETEGGSKMGGGVAKQFPVV